MSDDSYQVEMSFFAIAWIEVIRCFDRKCASTELSTYKSQ